MPGGADVNVIALANQAVDGLKQPLGWPREKLKGAGCRGGGQRVREQVGHKLGQTLSLDQHCCGSVGFSSCCRRAGMTTVICCAMRLNLVHAINHWLPVVGPLPTCNTYKTASYRVQALAA